MAVGVVELDLVAPPRVAVPVARPQSWLSSKSPVAAPLKSHRRSGVHSLVEGVAEPDRACSDFDAEAGAGRAVTGAEENEKYEQDAVIITLPVSEAIPARPHASVGKMSRRARIQGTAPRKSPDWRKLRSAEGEAPGVLCNRSYVVNWTF